jgi:hypothetical protein
MAWPWNGEEDRPTATQVGKSREFHYDHLYIFCLRRASALDEWLRKKVEKEKNPIFLVVEKGEKQELVGILKRLHPKGLRYIVTINIEKEERNWKPFAEQLQKEFREPEKLTFGGETVHNKGRSWRFLLGRFSSRGRRVEGRLSRLDRQAAHLLANHRPMNQGRVSVLKRKPTVGTIALSQGSGILMTHR